VDGWVCCALFALFPVLSLCSMLVWARRMGPQLVAEKQELFELLQTWATKNGHELNDSTGQGIPVCEVRCTVLEHACRVRLGWHGSDFALDLCVESPRLNPDDFSDCWHRSWTRYLKRNYEDRLMVMDNAQRALLEGPAHCLRNTFDEVGLAAMATLFMTANTGRARHFLRVYVEAGQIAVTKESPGPDALRDLDARLEALVRLVRFSTRPFGEPAPKVALVVPKAVGTVPVTLQPDQHCAYCREGLAGSSPAELTTCAACQSTLHAECMTANRGCCTVGCRNNPRGRADVRPRERP